MFTSSSIFCWICESAGKSDCTVAVVEGGGELVLGVKSCLFVHVNKIQVRVSENIMTKQQLHTPNNMTVIDTVLIIISQIKPALQFKQKKIQVVV